MRYDRGYGMGMRYGADYQDHWSRLRARPAGMYDREYGYGRYDRPFRGGPGAREGYGGDYRAGPRGPRFPRADRFRQGPWSGPYGPLSQRQHWLSPWNDPVPGGGMGIGLG
jgi:hypothetical protein